MRKGNNSEKIRNIKYLSYFFTRAFLLSIVCFILIILASCIAYYADFLINVKTGNYKNPLFSGYVIVSQSMVPTINIDDGIFVKRESGDNYKVGDIISYSSSDSNYYGETVTHRIVSKNSVGNNVSNYVTKGDNNSLQDSVGVTTNDIYGKVMFVIPKLGQVQKFFDKPSNFLICFIIPIVLIITYDGYRIYVALSNRIQTDF